MPGRYIDRFRRLSVALALGVFAIGAIGSVQASHAVADRERDQVRDELESDATEVVEELQRAMAHAADLLGHATAVVISAGDRDPAQLATWIEEATLAERYPEVATLSVVDYRREADGAATCPARPGGYAAGDAVALSSGADVCEEAVGQALLESIPVGGGVYVADNGRGTGDLLLFQSILPGRDASFGSAEAREAAHRGWVVIGLRPEVVVREIADRQENTSIGITHQGAEKITLALAGRAPEPASTVHQDLGAGWSVDVSRTLHPVDTVGATTPGAVLAGGLIGSLLLALLIAIGGSLASVAARLRLRTSELHEQATRDPLTGMANRAEIRENLHNRIEANASTGGATGVLHVDLDDFKAVNDSLGHAAGDDLLRAAAARLSGCMRESDAIARIGGDEFVVVLGGPVDEATTHGVATRLLEVMRAPFHLPGAPSPVRTTVTIGATVCEGRTADGALQDANLALHQAKASGKNSIHVFHPQLAELQKQRFELQLAMTTALGENQFRLVYQPIWTSDSQQLVGVEALLRWQHPTLGMLAPDNFIPELESTGHIVEVGGWVLHEACRQLAEWQAAHPGLGVSVNASARQFADDRIIHDVRDALDHSGLRADLLTIEITETALMADPSISAARLQALRDLGCHVAIDDFGVGYSSLGYLQMFPADMLKIDRSFVNGLSRAPESLALVRAIVQLARDLHLETLAEGVETEDQLAVLRDHHVRLAQGYLVSPPLTPLDFEVQMLRPQRQSASPTPMSPATS
jgi:diguanylate cyclase (GGDEF)-like protein